MLTTGIRNSAGAFFILLVLLLSAPNAAGSIVLVNGLFNSTGTAYGSGLYAAVGWTNNSDLNIQASIAPAGFEDTPSDNGNNYLRLVSDYPDPENTGFIVQYLGTMVAGDTYEFTGDVLGGDGTDPWGATIELTSDGSSDPATVYSSQILSGYGPDVLAVGALEISYTATDSDNGNPLYLWLQAAPSGSGEAIRGGIADIQLTTVPSETPEPAAYFLLGSALVGLAMLRSKLVKR
jgi:hypothetical protein